MNIDKAIECCTNILVHLNREAMEEETAIGVKLEMERGQKWFITFSDYNDEELYTANDSSLPGVIQMALDELRGRLKDKNREATNLLDEAAMVLDDVRP